MLVGKINESFERSEVKEMNEQKQMTAEELREKVLRFCVAIKTQECIDRKDLCPAMPCYECKAASILSLMREAVEVIELGISDGYGKFITNDGIPTPEAQKIIDAEWQSLLRETIKKTRDEITGKRSRRSIMVSE
jgi:hypothetical protein